MDRIRRWGIGHPRRWWVCLSVLVVVTAACASPATQAPDSASTPTAAPTAMGKQAAADPTHTPMPTPNAIAERDSGSDPEPKSTPTPTPAASESPESDPEPTSTPTPTPTPAPPEEQMADPGPPATTTVAVTTTVVVPATPPLGDCFGGALSEHPLHCYVLKQAQAEGLIDVLAVYEGGDGRVLYVSINGELSGALYRFAEEKSYSFYDTWPELLPEEKYGVYGCDGTVRECYLELRYWHSNGGRFALLPPPRGGYKRLQVVPGEDAGRRSVRGLGVVAAGVVERSRAERDSNPWGWRKPHDRVRRLGCRRDQLPRDGLQSRTLRRWLPWVEEVPGCGLRRRAWVGRCCVHSGQEPPDGRS